MLPTFMGKQLKSPFLNREVSLLPVPVNEILSQLDAIYVSKLTEKGEAPSHQTRNTAWSHALGIFLNYNWGMLFFHPHTPPFIYNEFKETLARWNRPKTGAFTEQVYMLIEYLVIRASLARGHNEFLPYISPFDGDFRSLTSSFVEIIHGKLGKIRPQTTLTQESVREIMEGAWVEIWGAVKDRVMEMTQQDIRTTPKRPHYASFSHIHRSMAAALPPPLIHQQSAPFPGHFVAPKNTKEFYPFWKWYDDAAVFDQWNQWMKAIPDGHDEWSRAEQTWHTHMIAAAIYGTGMNHSMLDSVIQSRFNIQPNDEKDDYYNIMQSLRMPRPGEMPEYIQKVHLRLKRRRLEATRNSDRRSRRQRVSIRLDTIFREVHTLRQSRERYALQLQWQQEHPVHTQEADRARYAKEFQTYLEKHPRPPPKERDLSTAEGRRQFCPFFSPDGPSRLPSLDYWLQQRDVWMQTPNQILLQDGWVLPEWDGLPDTHPLFAVWEQKMQAAAPRVGEEGWARARAVWHEGIIHFALHESPRALECNDSARLAEYEAMMQTLAMPFPGCVWYYMQCVAVEIEQERRWKATEETLSREEASLGDWDKRVGTA